MVLATLLGALIGEICLLEKGVNTAVAKTILRYVIRNVTG